MLYHKEIGLPKDLITPYLGNYRLNYTRHAQLECVKDRYKLIKPPFELTLNLADIIEIESDNKTVQKIVARVSYDDNYDLIIAFIPLGIIGTVKTVWLNDKKDTHKTLDRSKYSPFDDSPEHHENFV